MMNCPQLNSQCGTDNMIELNTGAGTKTLTATQTHLSEKCSWAI